MSIDINELKEKAKYLDRASDKGFINPNTGSSVAVKNNGDSVVASNKNAQSKTNYEDESNTEVFIQKNIITNRLNIKTDEIILNKHKLNQLIYELSDIKDINKNAIGNLLMNGTVLVKAWEPHLNKYVLIRRPINLPLFSQTLNLSDVPSNMGIDTNVAEELKRING